MNYEQLIALMAAIVFAGSNNNGLGVSHELAVRHAMYLLKEIKKQLKEK